MFKFYNVLNAKNGVNCLTYQNIMDNNIKILNSMIVLKNYQSCSLKNKRAFLNHIE